MGGHGSAQQRAWEAWCLLPRRLLRATPSFSLSLQGVCTMTAAFLHFFFLSSFCWVLTEAWQSYLAVIGRMRTRLVRKRFLCLGWGEQGLCWTLPMGLGSRGSKTGSASALAALCGHRSQLGWVGFWEDERTLKTDSCFTLTSPVPLGLPALVVAVSVGFTRTKGYGTSS